jgi:hypothetical protein
MRLILATIAVIFLAVPSWGSDGDTVISIKSLTEWFIDFIKSVYEFEFNLNAIGKIIYFIGKIIYFIAISLLGVAFLFVKFVLPQLFLWIPLLSPFAYYQDKLQEKLDTSISTESWIKIFFLKRLLGLYGLLGGLCLFLLCGITIYFEFVFWAFISGLIVCSIIGIYVFLKMKKETVD